MNILIKRLKPNQDLKEEIERLVQEHNIQAGSVSCLVGSLTKLRLRVADGKTVKEWNEPFEIVSGTGTVSISKCHIHLSVSDQDGRVIGGHLKEGCLIGTTVELVIQVFDDIEFHREPDVQTGYDELVLREN